jgi:hypothetical protein
MVVDAVAAGDERASFGRPDPAVAKPQAACGLQELKSERAPAMARGVVFSAVAPAVMDDPLANYARTPLGDWQMPVEVDRADPWLRFVLFAIKRPVVIDAAVFVDGKPYADGREAWIDGVLDQSAKSVTNVSTALVDVKAPARTVEKKKSIVPQANEPPKVSAQARQAPSMRERLLAYVLQPGPAVDRREIRWLIAEWGFGPPVVVLDTSLSWQRAGVAPLLAYLDRDRSGALEAAEIAGAVELLERCDADANDVVDEKELRSKSDQPPVLPFATDHPLVAPINDAMDRGELVAQLKRVYGVGSEAIDRKLDGPADVTLRVDFGDDQTHKAGVALLASGPEADDAASTVSTTANVIVFDLGAEYVEFSAAGDVTADTDAGEAGIGRTQIAVGAAIDGNPLVRMVDTDQDHRLTRRERQQLGGFLSALDRDRDGAVTARELPIPIRFAVTLGPRVHTLLAQPTGAARTIAPAEPAPQAPDWFLSMDKNGDHDLSRGEFLGTPEQFGQFDADADGLLSVVEAQKMDAGE